MKRKDKMGFPVPLHLWSKNKGKGFYYGCPVIKKSKRKKYYQYTIC